MSLTFYASISTAEMPGIAKICLTDSDIHLTQNDAITIPATTVFSDSGPNIGKREIPSTWRYQIKAGSAFPASFLTLTEVSLRKNAPCADVNVQMMTGPLATEKSKRASDNHVFVIDDVLEYPVPVKRPPIEVGKLIDDISVKAILLTDVSQVVAKSLPPATDDATRAASCLASAKKLAVYLGGATGKQRNSSIEISNGGSDKILYGCAFGPKQKPDYAVYWDGRARPSPSTLALIAKGGEFVTGATGDEVLKETSACVGQALKPDAGEMADRQVRGVKLECQAFARDGGGGSVTIYRRFGSDPVR